MELNIRKSKVMASGPIILWQTDEETMETVADFILEAPKSLPEKAMAPRFSTLAWKIPWTEEPGRLQSTGSLSRAQLSDFTFTFIPHTRSKYNFTEETKSDEKKVK